MPRKTKTDPFAEFDLPETTVLGHRVTKQADGMLKEMAEAKGWKIAYTTEVAIRSLYALFIKSQV